MKGNLYQPHSARRTSGLGAVVLAIGALALFPGQGNAQQAQDSASAQSADSAKPVDSTEPKARRAARKPACANMGFIQICPKGPADTTQQSNTGAAATPPDSSEARRDETPEE